MINELIENIIKLENKIKYLSRQTIRNIILDSKLFKPATKELDTPETLYIITNEKWIRSLSHHFKINKNIKDILVSYIINDDKSNFIPCCNELISFSSHRKDTINQKKNIF